MESDARGTTLSAAVAASEDAITTKALELFVRFCDEVLRQDAGVRAMAAPATAELGGAVRALAPGGETDGTAVLRQLGDVNLLTFETATPVARILLGVCAIKKRQAEAVMHMAAAVEYAAVHGDEDMLVNAGKS